MIFTQDQYEKAIANLRDAMLQLEPDGRCCIVCHDTGHMAWECGHNPLYAMAICEDIAKRADEMHDEMHETDEAADRSSLSTAAFTRAKNLQRAAAHAFLHLLSGHDSWMGSMVGPRKVMLP